MAQLTTKIKHLTSALHKKVKLLKLFPIFYCIPSVILGDCITVGQTFAEGTRSNGAETEEAVEISKTN